MYNPDVTPRLSHDAWEAFLARHPDPHLLQTASCGESRLASAVGANGSLETSNR